MYIYWGLYFIFRFQPPFNCMIFNGPCKWPWTLRKSRRDPLLLISWPFLLWVRAGIWKWLVYVRCTFLPSNSHESYTSVILVFSNSITAWSLCSGKEEIKNIKGDWLRRQYKAYTKTAFCKKLVWCTLSGVQAISAKYLGFDVIFSSLAML